MSRVVVPPNYLVAMFGVPAMVRIPSKIGQTIEFQAHGRTFSVKRSNRTTWFLLSSESTRGRFGDLDQICEDVGRVLETGTMPRSKESFA